MKSNFFKKSLFLIVLFVPTLAFAGGFNTLFTNLGDQAVGFASFLTLIMGVAGGVAVAFGLFKAWKASDEQSRVEPKQIIIPLVVGGLMLAFSFIVNLSQESVGGGTRSAAPISAPMAF